MRWFLAGAFMVFLLVEDEQDRRPYITVAAQNTATAHLAIVTTLFSESDITYASFFSRFCVLLIQPFKKKKKKKGFGASMLRVEATKRWDRWEALRCDGAVSVSLSVCDEDDGVTPVMNQRRWLRRRRWEMTTAARIWICIAVCSKISKSRWLAAVCGSLCERERGAAVRSEGEG